MFYGRRVWRSFGVGLKERLDEIGVLGGGEDAEERRIQYKRDKAGGVNVTRQKAMAARVLVALAGRQRLMRTESFTEKGAKPWAQKSAAERALELKSVFNMIDANRDGNIDAKEFADSLRTLGFQASGEDVGRMLKELDKNKDGEIDLEEFTVVMTRKLDLQEISQLVKPTTASAFRQRSTAQQDAELKRLFDLFDSDKSGELDVDEVHFAFRAMGMDPSLDEVEQWVKDVDGQDEIDLAGFQKLFRERMLRPAATTKLEMAMESAALAQEVSAVPAAAAVVAATRAAAATCTGSVAACWLPAVRSVAASPAARLRSAAR
mmetsp:Transcript_10229/g.24080  ORF Transcript_10229/g.24080 Transcript_10229/m.24080 type:complete len:320 (-) Transcript_10229:90-1049(-)